MSGSIWSEQEVDESIYEPDPITTYTLEGGVQIAASSKAEAESIYRRQLEEEKLKDAPRARTNRPIAPAREKFAAKADALRQQLMRLLEAAYALKGGDLAAILPEVCAALENVDLLSLGIVNETERDLYAVCDLLAISLATTCAELAPAGAALPAEAREAPYLREAIAQAEGGNVR